jgi:cytochrome P450
MNGALDGVSRVLRGAAQTVAGRPREGVLSALVHATPGDRLADEQIIVLLRHLWFAGTTTLSLLLPAAIMKFCRAPDVVERLRRDPALIPAFLSEMLRLESPSQFVRRKCMHDMEFAGLPFRRGALVKLCLASANRDPGAFPDPDELRWDRVVHRHLAFGLGDHYCMGAVTARTIAAVAIGGLVQEFRSFSDAGNPGHPRYEASPTLRGLMPFRVTVV